MIEIAVGQPTANTRRSVQAHLLIAHRALFAVSAEQAQNHSSANAFIRSYPISFTEGFSRLSKGLCKCLHGERRAPHDPILKDYQRRLHMHLAKAC